MMQSFVYMNRVSNYLCYTPRGKCGSCDSLMEAWTCLGMSPLLRDKLTRFQPILGQAKDPKSASKRPKLFPLIIHLAAPSLATC